MANCKFSSKFSLDVPPVHSGIIMVCSSISQVYGIRGAHLISQSFRAAGRAKPSER